jgi:pilus assembly protein CpaE
VQVIVIGQPEGKVEGLLKQSGHTVVWLDESLVARRKASAGDVFVVDARGRDHLPPYVGPLTKEAPGSGFILLASTLDPALMLEAMRAGIRECLVEPLSQSDLDAAFSRVAAERAVEGLVFAFVGAKGGVGTTTTAVNVAMELSRIAPKHTLLMDLHLSNGDAAVFLGEEPRFSVADAIENAHRLDDAFLRSLVVRTKAQLDLLASPESTHAAPSDANRIRSLVQFTARNYRYTVLDVPRSEPAALEALDPADRIVVIANQELATVRSANRMVAALRQRYGKERVRVVVSRYDPAAGIGTDDIEKALGLKVGHSLPSDYRRAVEALNSGQPLSLQNHNDLAGAFRALARDLAGLPPAAETSKPSGRLLGLFGGRRS